MLTIRQSGMCCIETSRGEQHSQETTCQKVPFQENETQTVTTSTAQVVICGAGMAGVAAAYHLAVRQGMTNVVLVDERAPFTLTTDKGTAAYRNWFPGPGDTMVRFINRS